MMAEVLLGPYAEIALGFLLLAASALLAGWYTTFRRQ